MGTSDVYDDDLEDHNRQLPPKRRKFKNDGRSIWLIIFGVSAAFVLLLGCLIGGAALYIYWKAPTVKQLGTPPVVEESSWTERGRYTRNPKGRFKPSQRPPE